MPAEEVRDQRTAIVHGMPSDEMDDAVVDVLTRIPGSATRCTGTLIAPDLVVTALHCVSHYDNESVFRCNPDGTLDAEEPGHGTIGSAVDAENVEIHFGSAYDGEADAHGARIFTSGSTQICRNDIAIVVLDTELEGVAPVSLRLERAMVRREAMRIVGFGQTEVSGSSGRFVRTGVRVTDVGPDDTASVGSAAPRTFVLGEGACQGDSGGPAFSEETGALTGVYSLSGGPTCTSIGVKNVYTKIAPFTALVRQAFEAVGREPAAEASAAGGNAGNAGSASSGRSGVSGGGTEPEPIDPGGGTGSRYGSCGCSLPFVSARMTASWSLLGALLSMMVFRRRWGRRR